MFLWFPHFLIQLIVAKKTGCFALYWLLARANFAAVFLMFLFGAI
jgi:hypothetical protein